VANLHNGTNSNIFPDGTEIPAGTNVPSWWRRLHFGEFSQETAFNEFNVNELVRRSDLKNKKIDIHAYKPQCTYNINIERQAILSFFETKLGELKEFRDYGSSLYRAIGNPNVDLHYFIENDFNNIERFIPVVIDRELSQIIINGESARIEIRYTIEEERQDPITMDLNLVQ
jgi:hypothetical protein